LTVIGRCEWQLLSPCNGTGGSESDTDGSVPTPEVAAAGDGIIEAADNASSLVSCGCSGRACGIVEVKIVG